MASQFECMTWRGRIPFSERGPIFYGEMLWVDGWLQGLMCWLVLAAEGRKWLPMEEDWHTCAWAGKEEEAARRDQEAGKNRTEWHVGNN